MTQVLRFSCFLQSVLLLIPQDIPEDISHAAEETFFKGDVPVLKDIPLERAEDFAMAEPETLKAAIAAWEKEADAKRHKAKQDELQSLFEEYRSERRRGLV